MTHKQMLKKLGLTEDEHRDLVTKFAAFHSSLNENQRRVVRHSMPTAEQAAKSFGRGVTAEHIERLSTEAFSANVVGSFMPGGR